MQKRDLLILLFAIVICSGLFFIIFPGQNTHNTVADSITPKIVPDNRTGYPVSATLAPANPPNGTRLEIFDPEYGTVIRIYRDQDAFVPLKNNITAVLQAIRFQEKCSRPYNEFQVAKKDYRYVTLISSENISGRYCYNNISATCRNITADEFTVLLKKKTVTGTNATCSEGMSIFAYRAGNDAGIWRPGEDDNVLLESLNRNVQEIIEDRMS